MSVDSASTVVRGLVMVPRRISGIQRMDTGEIDMLQWKFVACQSPIDLASDLGGQPARFVLRERSVDNVSMVELAYLGVSIYL